MTLRVFSECSHAFNNASTATIPVVPAAPGQSLSLYRAVITANVSTNVTFQDSSGAALSETFPVGGIREVILNTQSNGDPWFSTAIGKGIQLAQSAAANIGFDVWTQAGPYPAGVLGGGPAVPVQVFVPTTWNPADNAGMTLSNSNQTATCSTAGGVRAVRGASAGNKFYYEAQITPWATVGNTFIGLATSTANLGTPGAQAAITMQIGNINIAGSNVGGLGTRSSGDIIGIALDMTSNNVWFRVAPSGFWNGVSTANPATNTGGLSVSALTPPLYPYFSSNNGGNAAIANFGASTFSGVVPAGFTAGWGVYQ